MNEKTLKDGVKKSEDDFIDGCYNSQMITIMIVDDALQSDDDLMVLNIRSRIKIP